MEIRKMKTKDLKIADYNPRKDLKPGDAEYEKIKRSIQEFQCVEPLVLNARTGLLVGGAQRLKVLIELGYDEIETVIVDLSPENERALNIALNAAVGAWDYEKLSTLLEQLQQVPDFDISLSGLSSPEISRILDDFHQAKDDDNFDADAALEKIDEPITKEGDLIILGRHRLLCGDSGNPEDLTKLMNGEKAALLTCDPPYGISYYQDKNARPQKNPRPKKCRRWDTIYNDSLNEEDYFKWIAQVFANMDKHLAEGAPVYVWNAWKQFYSMANILQNLQYHIGCIITWGKQSFTLGYGDYQQKTEFCLYAWKKENGAHRWYGPNNESTLWEVRRDPTKSYQHLTQKPVELFARAMRNSSLRDDVVLELFGGSGTAIIAAEQLDRKCYCMEKMPAFVDVIVRRYLAFAGKGKVSEEVYNRYMTEV